MLYIAQSVGPIHFLGNLQILFPWKLLIRNLNFYPLYLILSPGLMF